MNTKILTIVVVIVIIAGGFFLFTNKADGPILQPEAQENIEDLTNGAVTSNMPAPGFEGKVDEMIVIDAEETTSDSGASSEESTDQLLSEPGQEPTTPPSSITVVTYTDNGFSPETVTILKGESVRFKNESSSRMWVASDIHPTHTLYPIKSDNDCLGSSFDQCKTSVNGESWVFTFNAAGEWRLHNHVRASKRGTIIVK